MADAIARANLQKIIKLNKEKRDLEKEVAELRAGRADVHTDSGDAAARAEHKALAQLRAEHAAEMAELQRRLDQTPAAG